MLKYVARNLKAYVSILVSLRKLAPSRNITLIYLSLKPLLLMKNVDFSNRQRLKSASEII